MNSGDSNVHASQTRLVGINAEGTLKEEEVEEEDIEQKHAY